MKEDQVLWIGVQDRVLQRGEAISNKRWTLSWPKEDMRHELDRLWLWRWNELGVFVICVNFGIAFCVIRVKVDRSKKVSATLDYCEWEKERLGCEGSKKWRRKMEKESWNNLLIWESPRPEKDIHPAKANDLWPNAIPRLPFSSCRFSQ